MNHLFISYSRNDEKTVDQFVSLLRDRGYQIWQDKSGAGTGIPFSSKWFEVITEAIYSAEGALIFRSPSWENSTPCKKEADLIQKCAVPHRILDLSLVETEPDEVLKLIETFCYKEVHTASNRNRMTLFANAYALQQNADPWQLIDNGKTFHIRDHLNYLLVDLLDLSMLMKEGKYQTLNPEIYPYMKEYLSFARKATLRRLAVLALGALLVIGALILGVSAILAIARGSRENEISYQGLAIAGQIEETADTDPVLAMEKAVNLDSQYVMINSFLTLSLNAQKVEDAVLPAEVRLNAEETAALPASAEDPSVLRYQVSPSDSNGSLLLTDLQTGKYWSLNVPGLVDGYTWNPDGTKLLYWCDSRIFLYDPSGLGSPVELAENFQQIEEAGFTSRDGKVMIYARTVADNLLLWDDPIPDRLIRRNNIRYGIFPEGMDPSTIVYLDGQEIIINRDNQETVLTPAIDGILQGQYYTITRDGTLLAALCRKDSETHVAVIDLSDGTVLLDVLPPYQATALCFGPGDKALYSTGLGCALMKIDLSTGQVECSQEPYYNSNLTCYRDLLLLSDYYGDMVLYDQDLNQVSEYYYVNLMQIPFADLVVSEKQGFLFTVNRGAGSNVGCSRFDLNSGAVNLFVIEPREHVDANTAAAISADEEYIAFGYPDGTVCIYETLHMYPALNRHFLGESVSALSFSPDRRQLFVLGESGTVYTMDLDPFEPNNDLEDMQLHWTQLQDRLIEKGTAYYAGLSDDQEPSE